MPNKMTTFLLIKIFFDFCLLKNLIYTTIYICKLTFWGKGRFYDNHR